MRQAVEHAISLRYVLRSMGVKVSKPTTLFGDNLGVIQNASIPDSDLKKKHVAIAYHYVREAIAAKIINVVWIKSHENFSDLCTKALGKISFHDLNDDMMV